MRSELTVQIDGGNSEAIAARVNELVENAELDVGDGVRITVQTASYGGPRRNVALLNVLEDMDIDVWEDATFTEETGDKRLEGALWNGPNGVTFHEVAEIPA